MIQTNQYPDHTRSGIAVLLSRILAECEDFGARYQYSPRLMIVGVLFAAVRLCKFPLVR